MIYRLIGVFRYDRAGTVRKTVRLGCGSSDQLALSRIKKKNAANLSNFQLVLK
jgi:hypothetical protein